MKFLAEWQFPVTARDIARAHNETVHGWRRCARLELEDRILAQPEGMAMYRVVCDECGEETDDGPTDMRTAP